MFSIRLNLLLKVFPQGVRQQVHQEDNEYQHQCRAVGDGKLRFHIGAASRDDVEVIRKRHALVEDSGRQLRQEVGGTAVAVFRKKKKIVKKPKKMIHASTPDSVR